MRRREGVRLVDVTREAMDGSSVGTSENHVNVWGNELTRGRTE